MLHVTHCTYSGAVVLGSQAIFSSQAAVKLKVYGEALRNSSHCKANSICLLAITKHKWLFIPRRSIYSLARQLWPDAALILISRQISNLYPVALYNYHGDARSESRGLCLSTIELLIKSRNRNWWSCNQGKPKEAKTITKQQYSQPQDGWSIIIILNKLLWLKNNEMQWLMVNHYFQDMSCVKHCYHWWLGIRSIQFFFRNLLQGSVVQQVREKIIVIHDCCMIVYCQSSKNHLHCESCFDSANQWVHWGNSLMNGWWIAKANL